MKFELIKGDEDNLEGKVIVYSKYTGKAAEFQLAPEGPSIDLENGEVFAVYFTTDPTDLFERFGPIPDEIKQKIDEAGKDVFSDVNVEKLIKCYGIKVPMSETDILCAPEDVLFVGEYSHPPMCIKAVELGSQFYFMNLVEHVGEKMGVKIHKNGKKQEEPPAVTHKDMQGQDVKNYITKEYVFPMIRAVEGNEEDKLKKLQKEFLGFCADSHFSGDAIMLCNLIRNDGMNGQLIEAYVAKMAAVHIEDYKAAAKARDKIKKLSK